MPVAIGAAGAIVHYLKHQLRRKTSHIRSLGVFLSDQFVALDAATQQNLELIRSRGGPAKIPACCAALDRTLTPMGGRLFRQWLLKPLRRMAEIRQSQEMIQQFLDQPFLLNSVRETLGNIRDMERTTGPLESVKRQCPRHGCAPTFTRIVAGAQGAPCGSRESLLWRR